jgi:catechol 2,3-dioxygenase-like lactoylglutathione lyase family enzyme
MDNDEGHAMEPVNGFSHIALVTADLDRLAAFYIDIFGAELVQVDDVPGTGRIGIVRVGGGVAMNLFEVPSSDHTAGRPTMFGRGHVDHFGVTATDEASFHELRRRLVERGCSDGAIVAFGPVIGFDCTDPDGMTVEVNLILDPTWRDGHEPRPYPETALA